MSAVTSYKMTNDYGIGAHGRMYQKSHSLFNETGRVHSGGKIDPLSPLTLEAS